MGDLLKGKVAIITGSGRGIGQATALKFAKEGAKVVVSDIDALPAEETVGRIIDSGGEAVSYVGDVMVPDFAQGIVQKAVDTWGGLHIIVNNAGFTWDGMIHKMGDEQWDKILNIHLKAPYRIIKAAHPYFCNAAMEEIEKKGMATARKIVNVSSVAGVGGNLGQVNYSSAKAGIIGLTKTMSKEWARYNVQANCVAFGFIDTRLTQDKEKGIEVDTGKEKVAVGVPAKQRDLFIRMIPMQRPGTPEEAANTILFFASPLSNYVSGQVLICGGGFSM
ncbi:beta-ketoacyl-ACP reductase [Desulfosarcina alkanivorans]|jgi:3-oxoacyl-[acyl-carrier protein] reductase|uniref:Beta-ketoacyl-ACP reductase n=1 Tax=Desulfosarcina alkanivorans TaxID=571177 RepID=A0A5K7YN01_9BACT|nr:SDR family NAD(P)-dependent oxidoreductase [Desulfosarcina alkanivorans]BBO69793.1 beta-ketoacyl-ACP reductase [Desulfosarcina alkanivorans]